MVTLEEFLDRKTPDWESSNTRSGPNTVNANYSHIDQVEDWSEFNYKTLKNLYGEVLNQEIGNVSPEKNPTELEKEIWEELQFTLAFAQYILSPIRLALELAYEYCEKSWKLNPQGEFLSPVDPNTGGRAKRPKDSDDPRFRPDWSCVRKGHMTPTTPTSYFNYCPGDTKLAVKWKHEWHQTEFKAWKTPPEQIQSYCGDHWNVRYGWIISEEGVTVFLITRYSVEQGLSSSKESRVTARAPLGHARVASGQTDLSSVFAPLSISSESYQDDHPNVEYQPIKAKFIPWHAKGLNGKKALFLLLMLAGAPGGPKLVQSAYPPLDSWWRYGEMYRHNSTGRVKKRLHTDDVVCNLSGQTVGQTSSTEQPEPTTTAASDKSELTRSVVEKMKWSDEYKMYHYWDSDNNCQWITKATRLFDEESGEHGVFDEGQWTGVEAAGQERDDKREKRRKVEVKKKR